VDIAANETVTDGFMKTSFAFALIFSSEKAILSVEFTKNVENLVVIFNNQ